MTFHRPVQDTTTKQPVNALEQTNELLTNIVKAAKALKKLKKKKNARQ